jgi:iron complex outermembrane receptor protein
VTVARGAFACFADQTYIASVQNSSSANGGMIYGAPLQYGARVKFTFGD